MNTDNIKVNIKRFFSNPNTLTFLLVIALIVAVYFVYSYMVNRAVKPASIPYALQKITSKKEITKDMVSNVKISGTFITQTGRGLIQNSRSLIGKYVAEGYQIPEKSFFYTEQLVDEKTAEKTPVADAPDGYTVFDLDVDFHSTYGCSIMPGNYIDLYFKATDDQDFIMFGKFVESLKVTKVVDKDGNDVFALEDDVKQPKPSKLYFIVPREYNDLLRKALLISSNNIEIIPVPRNAGYSENPKETQIVNEEIEDFILSKSVYLAG